MGEQEHLVRIKRILHPTDFSDSSGYALGYAVAFAREFGAKLHLLHVIEDVAHALYFDMLQTPPVGDILGELKRQAEKELDRMLRDSCAGLDVERLICKGVPFREIVRTARELEVDLIVLGTHGRTGIKHVLFGSVAERVVRKASCPVLSVRHPKQEFEMP